MANAGTKTVCICFDYENDKQYRYLLNAWDTNSDFSFSFNDLTPVEIQSNDIARIKAVLTQRINEASYLLVIVGKEANKLHRDSAKIGYRNWQNFEIARAKAALPKKRIVAVKINAQYESPEELFSAGAAWAKSFTQEAVIRALNEA